MPKGKIIANWSAAWHRKYNIPKGFILLRYDRLYRKSIGEELLKLDNFQNEKKQKLVDSGKDFEEKDYLRDIDIAYEYHFKKRTLDQNALMWPLYEIEANEMNGGDKGHKDQMVTAMELYEADLHNNGEREIITTKRKHLGQYLTEYRIILSVVYNEKTYEDVQAFARMDVFTETKIEIEVIRGTSQFDTVEMTKWIEMIFNRIAYHGIPVTNPKDIKSYWHKWKQMLNDNKIEIHDTVLTQAEYKALNPICEACGDVITSGGELHHIKAVGMGNDRSDEPHRNYSSNWLHLCVNCHRSIYHQKGVNEFLKLYHHLTYKVKTALNRDYDDIEYWRDVTPVDNTKQLEFIPEPAVEEIPEEEEIF